MRPGKTFPEVKETPAAIQLAPKKIRFELVREVEGQTKPVVIKSKMIEKTQEIVVFRRLKPVPRAYFVRSLIRRESIVKGILWGTKKKIQYVARCNLYWSESLKNDDEILPQYSQELENLKVADDVIQHRDSIAAMQRFLFDSEFIKIIVVVFALAIPFGIFLNTLLNLIPTTVVTWQP